jgi:hypothetical protein
VKGDRAGRSFELDGAVLLNMTIWAQSRHRSPQHLTSYRSHHHAVLSQPLALRPSCYSLRGTQSTTRLQAEGRRRRTSRTRGHLMGPRRRVFELWQVQLSSTRTLSLSDLAQTSDLTFMALVPPAARGPRTLEANTGPSAPSPRLPPSIE